MLKAATLKLWLDILQFPKNEYFKLKNKKKVKAKGYVWSLIKSEKKRK